jgi:hypothetical protein
MSEAKRDEHDGEWLPQQLDRYADVHRRLREQSAAYRRAVG